MSNLIDLDATVESAQLAVPLLPCPSTSGTSDEPRASLGPGDNPFDRAVRQVNRFAALQNDPFEIVSDAPARLSSSFGPSYSNFQMSLRARSNSLSNVSSIEPDISILIDPPSSPENLSILNDSQMDDSFGQAMARNSSFIRGMSNPLLISHRHGSLNSVYSNTSSTYSDLLNKAFRIEGSFNSSVRSASFSDKSDLLPLSYKQIQTAESPHTALTQNFGEMSIADQLVVNTQDSIPISPSELPIDQPLTSMSPPDFDILPPSDDESDLIQLAKSPKSPNQKVDEEPTNVQNKEAENIVAEVESDMFSLSDPKNRQFAMTRILELKNLVKMDKPEVAKLLDDLESIMGLNCKNNAELLAACLPNSNEDKENVENKAVKEKQDLEDTEKVEPKMENVMSYLENLVQDSSKIDPAMQELLQNVGEVLHKIPLAAKSPAKKNGTKVRRSKSFNLPRRSTTPESRIQMGIPTLRNSSPRKSSAVSKIKSVKSDSKNNQGSVPEIPIVNTKLATDIKSKLKRKVVAEPALKKGPLKAVIPVNNMQKIEIVKNPPSLSPPNTLDVSEKVPMASSTPIIRRSFSQIKPRNFNARENFIKPASPRENRLPIYSPIKMSSPRRGIPIFFKAKPQKKIMSPLRTNNQHLRIPSSPMAKRMNLSSNLNDDKENQY